MTDTTATTITFSTIALPEPAVNSNTGTLEATTDYRLLVTGAVSDLVAEAVKGRVITARVMDPNSLYWYNASEGVHQGRLVTGALLRPEPRNGAYYRLIHLDERNPAASRHGLLLQYFDAEHTSDRHRVHSPFNVIAGPDGPWEYQRDSWADHGGDADMVEVEYTPAEAVSEPRQTEEPETAEPEAVTEPEPEQADPSWGLGTGPLKPELIPGTMYVWWEGETDDARRQIGTYVGKMHEDMMKFSRAALATKPGGDDVLITRYRDTMHYRGEDAIDWQALHLTRPTPVEEEAQTAFAAHLIRQAEQERGRLVEFNDALNEYADSKQWCDDYESIVVPLGLEPREDRRKRAWDVEVSADFTISDTGLRSEWDTAAYREWGESISVSSVTVEASLSFTVTVYDVADEEGVRDFITHSWIEEQLDERLSTSCDSMSDYNILSIEEGEDDRD